MAALNGLHFLDSIDLVAPRDWDALLPRTPPPCLHHAYLHALEASACVGPDSGWIPRHATLWKEGRLIAAMPLYLKAHSWGEYVFDWAWARAYQQHGLDYYPKWLAAIPFTPIPGPRVLGLAHEARRTLVDGVRSLAENSGLSSLHVLFPDDDDLPLLQDAGLSVRHGVQFHWENAGKGANAYTDFADFLAGLNHDKRKKIRQERRRAAMHSLRMRWLDGHSAGPGDWAFLYRCYANTYALHRSTPYLNLDFFLRLASGLPDKVSLLLAEREDGPVACAFFLRDDEALYGRYWGAVEALPFLHFELCYYQAIEYCIRHGLRRFEGGAQGEHKLARGLMPARTQSVHWIADPRFRAAVDDYLDRERSQMGFYLDELGEHAPYRNGL
ncbi:GNAT family N-acetyltransferase [Thauera linaloolentis]|uniref:N-acetyltransferase n=1 Tax=Thauera linaloolentis (strain DSM 12138 / JCM 21573 / CCUG 41526 / CIP 105981 / IAM 15112 / NBRC 102519 / 47Lol) TaxID=1123367 RepID=N6ZD16_THAL4|nr:GNAT family N-acetyltransferase [Thauera linaloolentis]ENO90084.1 hypothetical protein C666_03435 [Thauera linaloolentis 47Lol = DSM 12138]MCM8565368.1 GNAT family N-acetyltransferase [Thauera linaloolentis]